MEDESPIILVECKACLDSLEKHASQLYRYFGTSEAKFGILTNGLIYKFYTDLEDQNKMDLQPFLEINMLNLKDSQITELKKFRKNDFDKDKILSTASELKYTNLIKELFAREMDSPSDDFVRFVLSNIYDGQKTQKIVDKFNSVVKKAFIGYMNELVNQKISSAISEDTPTESGPDEPQEIESKVITTPEEIEAFYIIRGLLVGLCDINDIAHRDTESYFGILYQNNNRKPICRLNLDSKKKQMLIPNDKKQFTRYYIESLNDIYQYKDQIIAALNIYLG